MMQDVKFSIWRPRNVMYVYEHLKEKKNDSLVTDGEAQRMNMHKLFHTK